MRDSKPVIGLISREYPPHTHVGGIGTYTATAARLLADHGHEVHVFCNAPETKRETDRGITLHGLRMENHPLPQAHWLYPYRRWFRKRLPHYLDSLTWSHTVANYLAREAANLHLDAFEFPETNGEGACLEINSGLNRTRRVCRIHTSWIPEYVTGSLESRLLLRLQRLACRNANRVVSPSRHMAEHYAKKVLGWKNAVDVTPNPLRLWNEYFDWNGKQPNHLLFVGRIEHRKGLDLLLAALDSLGDKGRELVLRVVGPRHAPDNPADAACQAALDQALEKHGGDSPFGYRLEYFGPAEHSALHRHFDWAGIVVLPSRQDNYPYTALEALSRGCFVVASEVGGLPETLEGCEGEIFVSEDKADLVRKMGELAQNDDRVRKSWLPNAQAIAERFKPETCYLRLMKTYAGPQGTAEPSAVRRE